MKTFLANRSGVSDRRLDIEAIRAASPILDVVREESGADLQQRGLDDWWACCPLHTENSPSFHVTPSRGMFHCFGCGEGGDVFRFVEKWKRVGFRDALAHLARRPGAEAQSSSAAPRHREIILASELPLTWSAPDAAKMQHAFREGLSAERLDELAEIWKLPPEHVARPGTGWCDERHAWTFPLWIRDRISGWHLRTRDGRKVSLKGTRLGLVRDHDHRPSLPGLFVFTEGESCMASALSIGLSAAARPGCRTVDRVARDYLRAKLPLLGEQPCLAIMADRDPSGECGAWRLAQSLVRVVRHVRVVTPEAPHKDLRDAVTEGALTREQFVELVARSPGFIDGEPRVGGAA